MRKNLPVTNVEHLLVDGQFIVSKTDTKGRITYVNPAFIDISGFSEAELLGQPHNLVRHPDMPEEAFADLWETLKSGIPWTGLVKNRCKNGDFYWVLANVTPVLDNGVVTGYMSVRTKPSREQINAVAEIYLRFKAERDVPLAINRARHGWRQRAIVCGLHRAVACAGRCANLAKRRGRRVWRGAAVPLVFHACGHRATAQDGDQGRAHHRRRRSVGQIHFRAWR